METVTFQPNGWGLLIGVVLPLVVGLVTKKMTPSSVKAVLLLFFSALNGIITEYVASISAGSYDWSTALYTWGGSFILAVGMHFGLLKPTGVSARAQASLNK